MIADELQELVDEAEMKMERSSTIRLQRKRSQRLGPQIFCTGFEPLWRDITRSRASIQTYGFT